MQRGCAPSLFDVIKTLKPPGRFAPATSFLGCSRRSLKCGWGGESPLGNVSQEQVCAMPLPLVEKTGVSLLLPCVEGAVWGLLPRAQWITRRCTFCPKLVGGRTVFFAFHLSGQVFWARRRLVVHFVVRLVCRLGIWVEAAPLGSTDSRSKGSDAST